MQNKLQNWLDRQISLYVMYEFSFCIRKHQSMIDRFMEDLIQDRMQAP